MDFVIMEISEMHFQFYQKKKKKFQKKLLKMFIEYSLRLGATLFSFLNHQSLKLKGLVFKVR